MSLKYWIACESGIYLKRWMFQLKGKGKRNVRFGIIRKFCGSFYLFCEHLMWRIDDDISRFVAFSNHSVDACFYFHSCLIMFTYTSFWSIKSIQLYCLWSLIAKKMILKCNNEKKVFQQAFTYECWVDIYYFPKYYNKRKIGSYSLYFPSEKIPDEKNRCYCSFLQLRICYCCFEFFPL